MLDRPEAPDDSDLVGLQDRHAGGQVTGHGEHEGTNPRTAPAHGFCSSLALVVARASCP